MSVGILGVRLRGAKIAAIAFSGAGTTLAKGIPGLLDGAAYDTCEWDTDGYTGAIVHPASVNLKRIEDGLDPPNYAGTGILTVPAGRAGVHRIVVYPRPGGLTIGVGTQEAVAPWVEIGLAAGGTFEPSPWGPWVSAVQSATMPLSEPTAGAAFCLYLNEGDTIQAKARGDWNDAPTPTVSVQCWCDLEVQHLGRA